MCGLVVRREFMLNRGLWVASSLPGFVDLLSLWAGASSPHGSGATQDIFLCNPWQTFHWKSIRGQGSLPEEDQKDCNVLLETLLASVPPLPSHRGAATVQWGQVIGSAPLIYPEIR